MAHALGIRRCKCVIESLFVCKKHEKTACFAAVAGMKPMEQDFILLDEGPQCALPDFIGDLIDALEILRALFRAMSRSLFLPTPQEPRIWPSNRLAPKKG
jgi:hypothetical protein